jgi:hypothetical protein
MVAVIPYSLHASMIHLLRGDFLLETRELRLGRSELVDLESLPFVDLPGPRHKIAGPRGEPLDMIFQVRELDARIGQLLGLFGAALLEQFALPLGLFELLLELKVIGRSGRAALLGGNRAGIEPRLLD